MDFINTKYKSYSPWARYMKLGKVLLIELYP